MVSLLGAAKKQMVEIARAVLHNAKVIIFDEPTASLTPEEKKYFFDLVRDLKARGVSVIFISHALEEALLISDRITVLRDGKHVVTDDTRELRPRAHRPGDGRARPVADALRPAQGRRVRPPGERVLSVQNLRMAAMVKNNSLSVFAGQITGVFGLVGSGRTETFKVVAGVIKRDFFHGGEMLLRRQAGALPRAGAGGRATASSTSPRTARSRASSRPCRSPSNIYVGLLAKLRRQRQLVVADARRATVGAEVDRARSTSAPSART